VATEAHAGIFEIQSRAVSTGGDLVLHLESGDISQCSVFDNSVTVSDTVCVGDPLAWTGPGTCELTGSPSSFQAHCEYDLMIGECTFHYEVDSEGTSSSSGYTFSSTTTITGSGTCEGTCVITSSGTGTRLSDPVCPSPAKLGDDRVFRFSTPVLPELP
jgi:hypothetical protein